ncbi:MATE efflux family protein [Treponema phagedenis F0421]|nr:MATE efflux family protein [Treponema phagedenis F0421]
MLYMSILQKQTTAERRELILHSAPVKTLIILSLPTLMTSMVQALVPLTDNLFINNLTDVITASAVSFSQPIILMVTALSMGLGVAATAIIGQLNGRGEIETARKISTQIFIFSCALGLAAAPVLLVLSKIVEKSLVSDIAHSVFLYLSLYSIVLPFAFLEAIYNGIKNANGKPEAPFIRMVILLILKIIGNFIFLYELRLDIVGCVLASLLANGIITFWMFFELFFANGPDTLTLKGFHFEWHVIKQLIKVGFPAMLNFAFLYFGFFLINKEVERYGPVVLNGQNIASAITTICFNLPAAFSAAVTTMVSMYIGAENKKKAQRSCLLGCIASAITAVALIAIIVPLSPHLTILFRREPDILEVANNALHIYTYSIVGFGVCMTIQGAFIGLGKTKIPLVLGILRIWLLRYVFILFTVKTLSYYAVFWGNLFSNYCAALIAIILILNTKWKSDINLNPGESLTTSQ